MRVFQFLSGQVSELSGSEAAAAVEPAAFYWLDVERSETDWHLKAQPWLKIQLHERHIQDSFNESHPPYYDGTDEYDLLVAHTLCPNCLPEAPRTIPIAFVISNNAVVTIRQPEDPVFLKLAKRFIESPRRTPASPAVLLYLLLNQITDTLLMRRAVTTDLLSQWQERLLDLNDQFGDWQALMGLHGRLRRLEVVAETEMDALTEWREQTTLALDSTLAVRFNDLQEHLRRVYDHTIVVQHDIDALVQIYFSANTQRTNEILQFLTIISAVFLPLNLLAGVFGMNFVHLPLLQLWYGPMIVSGLMLTIVAGLLLWFRHRHWI
jgi:magnesium/cobalt transport protein CorA